MTYRNVDEAIAEQGREALGVARKNRRERRKAVMDALRAEAANARADATQRISDAIAERDALKVRLFDVIQERDELIRKLASIGVVVAKGAP